MDTGSKLLIAYMEALIAQPNGFAKDGFPVRMQACMLLDRVAGDLMDAAGSTQAAHQIFDVYSSIKGNVLLRAEET